MAIEVPAGFVMNGVAAGIKKTGKDDFTLIHCPGGATAAGVYTQNLVFAAPVGFDRARTPSNNIRVIAVNSGNANACTGERGMNDCKEMARLASVACGEDESTSLVMSTGVIGVFLPMDKIANGAKLAAANLGNSEASFLAAARGIMTTDQFHKVVGKTLDLGGRAIRLAGMCKGAGMIGPNMATMLAIMLTDAKLTPADAQRVLKAATDESFNCISVEGHTSTNDTLLLVASGAAGGEPLSGSDLQKFQAALTDACIELAQQIPDDGEGASHLICIEIKGAKDQASGQQIARTVANSALVKTAVAGADPNWGRIVSAAGYAGVPFQPEGVGLIVNGHELYRAGAPVAFDAKTVSAAIKNNRKTDITLTFTEGTTTSRFWTSDLNVNYVRFNADYTT
ncbi:bifunctional glutamate N-acetyltransferase/amino-acid acetyltransferase ArgJ [Anatilimnocola floriformis]|uniref:bifunctional glutamate N-acetyltransferase/amino-acid acetyltransferase ArgJ n=1 Tax=Anatilimnocola floriformis TaxID=2948575 RepID=UPI0020C4A7D6|nr:bifunctional glutamate N-acetyltransferase/amino-acid acetyltransferase ArgJ [Anatilimnocola floriformis]